ncbi:CD276 antigen homolog [Sparus aurata]|uniref:CD276 antigen homolog n=1 Tax=Sparus aurata TaxID=8175 RepID=UPI0011C1B974|nr:CD276 antigen homolog [Sparus aurata]
MSPSQRCAHVLLLMFSVCRMSPVSCQNKVNASVGETVLLTCSVSEVGLALKDASVYWTDKDDNTVLDIIKNEPDLSSQSDRYKDRVSSFPDRYQAGNFSIQMKKVQLSDSSPYDCKVPQLGFRNRVTLNVSAKRNGPGPEPGPEPGPGPSGGAVVTLNSIHMTVLSVTVLSCFI